MNRNVPPQTRILAMERNERFHANYFIYGSRLGGLMTHFVYASDESVINRGLKKLKPDYYLFWKTMAGQQNMPMTSPDDLDKKFERVREFRSFILYKINPETFD